MHLESVEMVQQGIRNRIAYETILLTSSFSSVRKVPTALFSVFAARPMPAVTPFRLFSGLRDFLACDSESLRFRGILNREKCDILNEL